MKSDNILEKALGVYAVKNQIEKAGIDKVTASLPDLKAKVSTLTEKEIQEIKSQVGKDKLQELQDIINSIK